jgi:hypothetical protein
MNEQTVTWSFDRDDIFSSMGFSTDDNNLLKAKAEDFIRALQEVAPNLSVDHYESRKPTASSSAPLIIPGTKYHINLTSSSRFVLIGAVKIVASAYLLHNLRLLDLSISLSGLAIATLLTQITNLTEQQRTIIQTIYDLKRTRNSRLYWPTTEQIAEKMEETSDNIRDELMPLLHRVVEYDNDKKQWRTIW